MRLGNVKEHYLKFGVEAGRLKGTTGDLVAVKLQSNMGSIGLSAQLLHPPQSGSSGNL